MSSLERCPLFRVSFIGRLYCSVGGFDMKVFVNCSWLRPLGSNALHGVTATAQAMVSTVSETAPPNRTTHRQALRLHNGSSSWRVHACLQDSETTAQTSVTSYWYLFSSKGDNRQSGWLREMGVRHTHTHMCIHTRTLLTIFLVVSVVCLCRG